MRTQLANSSPASNLAAMSKSNTTLSFRPNAWEERAIAAAEQATGRNRSELLRRCVTYALPHIVKNLLKEHETSVQTFEQVLKEAPSGNRATKY